MKLRIIHETEYFFNSEVFFEPHLFRFKPKHSPHITTEHFNILVTPVPAGISEHVDAENNPVHLCWFENEHKKMVIESELVISSYDFNPFNFIIHPLEFMQYPFDYDQKLKVILNPSLMAEALSSEIIEYGKKILLESQSGTVEFLMNLTRQIHSDFSLEIREQGKPMKADKTFSIKTGSCRDLAWMQIMLLRNFGYAARFVSGYYFLNIEEADYELHAWVEVYLPGAGWIGFDPSHGMMTGSSHIPIASGSLPENTMPVSGTIRGDAKSTLKTNLKIEILD